MIKPKLAAALVLSVAAAMTFALILPAHAADEKAKHMVSKEFGKPLKAAQEALQKGDYSDALAQIEKARALPNPKPWDTHIINYLSVYAYVKTKNYPGAAKSMEALLDDGLTEPADANRYLKELPAIYSALKDNDKTIEYGQRAIKAGAADSETYLIVGQAYYLKGDYKNAQHFNETQVNNEIKQGQAPKEAQLQWILNACVKLDDSACETRALEKLVAYYPKPEYWEDIVSSLFTSSGAKELSDSDTLNIYRLASDVGAMTKPSQYLEMAQLALEQGSPGDAQHILEAGNAKNIFTDQRDHERAERVLTLAKKRATEDQASLPKLASEAESSPTGDKSVAVGMAYLGYQQYDKAADALAQGLMKGGVRDQAQAQLLLGIAQLKAGKKDDAVKSFHAVSGDPTLVRLANLWNLRAHGSEGTVAAT